MSATEERKIELKEYARSLSDDDFNALQSIMSNENHKRQREDEINSLIAHKEYVGKCYKYQFSNDLTLYRMIISPQGNNECHVTAFQFRSNPKVENHRTAVAKVYHEIEYYPFDTVSWGIFCHKSAFASSRTPHFSDWTEISMAEFFYAMDAVYCDMKGKLMHNSFDITDEEIEKERKG